MSEVINVIQTDQLTFFFLVFLSVINLIMAIKVRIPLVNFVVSVFTLGMAAVTIGNTALFMNGYIQMFTLITAILSMMMALKELRQ